MSKWEASGYLIMTKVCEIKFKIANANSVQSIGNGEWRQLFQGGGYWADRAPFPAHAPIKIVGSLLCRGR